MKLFWNVFRLIIPVLKSAFKQSATKFLEFFIRKGAHFGTYFLSGSFLYLGIKDRMNVKWLAAFLCVLASLGYAATDEFHQMITGDRTPLFQDVMLDGTGALCGILLCILCELIYLRVEKKREIDFAPMMMIW